MLSLSTLRRALEETQGVVDAFLNSDSGELNITAGTIVKNASQYSDIYSEADAKAISLAIGAETVLFRVIPRSQGSDLPVVVSAMAYAGEKGVELRAADLAPLEGEVIAYRIGPGGYVVAAIGKAQVQVPMVVSEDLRNSLIMAREDGQTPPQFTEQKGVPPLTVDSPHDGEEIPTMKPVPQRDLPAYADIVPRYTDLEVTAVLELSRQYKSPRLRVTVVETGEVIEGLIATQPIVRCITGVYDGEAVLDEKVIGQRFQILDVEDRRRRDGDLVKNEDGSVQKTVIVRNTTVKREFSL